MEILRQWFQRFSADPQAVILVLVLLVGFVVVLTMGKMLGPVLAALVLAYLLEGLVAGAVEVEGSAAGSILVRNPNFSLAFSHPRTIRSGEPYTASVTVLNTSPTVANHCSPACFTFGSSL